jgi:hypothetical protein
MQASAISRRRDGLRKLWSPYKKARIATLLPRVICMIHLEGKYRSNGTHGSQNAPRTGVA